MNYKIDKFKIPRKFEILNNEWSVEIHDKICGRIGDCSNSKRLIRLTKTKDMNRLIDCYFHELSHSILFTILPDFNKENVVAPLSLAIRDVVLGLVELNTEKEIETKKRKKRRKKHDTTIKKSRKSNKVA